MQINFENQENEIISTKQADIIVNVGAKREGETYISIRSKSVDVTEIVESIYNKHGIGIYPISSKIGGVMIKGEKTLEEIKEIFGENQ